MVILQSLALAALIALPGRRWLKAHSKACYLAAALLSLSAVAGLWSGFFGTLPGWISRFVVPMFTKGALSGALFCFVMYASAVPDGSPFIRAVMPVRGELSILAGILAVGHALALGKAQLLHLLGGYPFTAALAVSVLLLAVMLPLLVTSFRRIRRRMKPKAWKRLQRWAYAFYALMLLHVLLFNIYPARAGSTGARINVAVYSALLLSYGVLRSEKALRKHARAASPLPRLAGAAAFIGLLALSLSGSGLPGPVTASVLEQTAAPEARYIDGKYSGAGVGYNGRLTVSVIVEDGAVAQVRLTGSVDDEPYLTDATEGVFPAVLAAGSAQVDAVSGATSTSEGLIAAIQAALDKALPTEE